MTRFNARLWLFAAVSVADFGLACGDIGPNDGGSGCTTDSSCGTGKMCHPLLKTCIPTCTGSGDCPSTAKTCRTFSGADPGDAGTALAFCQCATDALCGGGNTVCMAATKTCENKCTASSCWGGATCNTTTGQWGSGGTDGGSDGGTASCGYNPSTLCTVSPNTFCDWATLTCKAPATCSTANVQPDTCGYGGYCASGSCSQVRLPTCANFTPPGGKTPTWMPNSTGPIIYTIDPDSSPTTAYCFKGFFVTSMYLNAYRTDASNFPAQLTALGGIWYVDSNGNQQDLTAGLPGSAYVPNGKQMRLRAYLCAPTSASFNAGYYLTGGNEVCVATPAGTAGTTNCTTNAQCGSKTCNTGTGTCT